MSQSSDSNASQKPYYAVCGLYCPSCTLYIATQEDPQRLENLAARMQRDPDEIKCDGCGSERMGPYCQICKMIKCADEKGIEYCAACDEYPCDELKEFQKAMPHRIELWNAQKRISEVGFAKWYEEMAGLYSCPECGTINSAYDIECRKCGNDPSCEYVKRHKEAILAYPVMLK